MSFFLCCPLFPLYVSLLYVFSTSLLSVSTSFPLSVFLSSLLFSSSLTHAYPQVLIGNKCDMNTEKAVDTTRGQALADEYGMKFFEVHTLSAATLSLSPSRCGFSVAAEAQSRGHKPTSQSAEHSSFASMRYRNSRFSL